MYQPIKINVVIKVGGGGGNTYEVPLDFKVEGGGHTPIPLLRRPYYLLIRKYYCYINTLCFYYDVFTARANKTTRSSSSSSSSY